MQKILDTLKRVYPHLLTPFIIDYFEWADKPAQEKPYFYGKWSLKWALATIIEEGATPTQLRTVMHHILLQLKGVEDTENIVQFNTTILVALSPWKEALNRRKIQTDINALPQFFAGKYKFVINESSDNLTSMIFRRTNADAIIARNPETLAASVIFRINSPINHLVGFKFYLYEELITSETGWKTLGQEDDPDKINVFINHGIQSGTSTIHTIETLTRIILNYSW